MQLHAHFLYSHTQLMAMAWPEGVLPNWLGGPAWADKGGEGGAFAKKAGFVCVNSHGREPDWLKPFCNVELAAGLMVVV